MFQGAKWPGSEWARVLLADSLLGANWPGSEKAVNPTYQISLKSTKHFVDGRTFETNFIRSTWRSLPNNAFLTAVGYKKTLITDCVS